MACPTYTADCIVVRKTKLGEADLILSLLAEDGRQIRAVAKGARKPTSSFSSRLELCSTAHVQLVQQRNLHLVREVRLIDGRPGLRGNLERSAAAAPVAELLDRVAQDGLESPKLYPLANTAFDCLACCAPENAAAVCQAALLKACSFVGFQPSLRHCAVCGAPLSGPVRFSYEEGGYLCAACAPLGAGVFMDAGLGAWLDQLLYSRLADVASMDCAGAPLAAGVDFCQRWIRQHVGVNVKSLGFLLSCGLT